MCHRMSPLTFAELQQALEELRRSGRARVPARDPSVTVPDAYPGVNVPLFVPDGDGDLVPTELTWGFPNPRPDDRRPVFNTRIERALDEARDGRGLWAEPIVRGRCLVPVRGFFEYWTQPDASDPTGTTRPRRQVRFSLEGHRFFLIACVRDETHFSVVTCHPNAAVAPVHNRMPLVLGPGESSIWLGPDYASLQDRSAVRLTAETETDRAPEPPRVTNV